MIETSEKFQIPGIIGESKIKSDIVRSGGFQEQGFDGREVLELCFSLSFVESMERCLYLLLDSRMPSYFSSAVSFGSSTAMKGGKKYGLEKSKLDLSQKTRESNSPFEIGGGGGDTRNMNFHVVKR